MTVYEYILKHKKVIFEMHNLGMLSASLLLDFEIYNYYLDAIKDNLPREAVTMAAEYFDISKKRVYYIRARMQ